MKIGAKILVSLFVLIMMLPTGLSVNTEEIDYLDHVYVVSELTGASMTLTNSSAPLSYVTITVESTSTNMTLFKLKSNNISSEVDYSFVNDTKSFEFLIQNETCSSILVLYVNYASVVVPINPYEAEINRLTLEIENITREINILNSSVHNLTENNTVMNASIIEKNDLISLLITEKNDLVTERDNMQTEWDSMKVERDNAITEVGTLTTTNTDLQTTIGTKNNEIDYLGDRVTAYQKSNDQLTNMFTLAYTDENGETRPCINIAWLVIGGVISVVCINIHKKRKEFGSSNTIVSMGKRFNIPFLSKGEKPSAKEWDMIESIDKMPSVEKEFLEKSKPKEKESEEESHDSDDKKKPEDVSTTQGTTKIVPEEAKQNVKPPEKPPETTVKKEDYWKSDKGLAHKARLKELAAGEK